LCDAPNGRGGAWAEDGTIVLSPSPARTSLFRVSSDGGKPEPVTSLVEGEATHRWPQVLPGGVAVLYTSSGSPGDFSDANLVAQPLPSGVPKIVQRGAYYGRYVPSGHLVYIDGNDGRPSSSGGWKSQVSR
jgi:serine/threonine-protein kinase